MLLKEFYRTVIFNEETATSYLQDHGLLDSAHTTNACHRCGSDMLQKGRRDRGGEFRPIFRCPRKGCQARRSVRDGNNFFHYTDVNNRLHSNLTLCDILELAFLFVQEIPLRTTVTLTGKSSSTVTDWFNMCREVCSAIVSYTARGQMVGTNDHPVQIDEARFAGRRKYHRGRMLDGDRPAMSEDSDADIENMRNHGARVDGPWVFGLKKGLDCRYFYVERRDRATLVPIIEREVQAGSVIHSDEWPAYRNLNQIGYIHMTVNHQQNYVDPATGAHTQAIERSWLDAKIQILKKMRGVPPNHFQSHLDHYCWKVLRKNEDLFLAFLRDIRTVYRQ